MANASASSENETPLRRGNWAALFFRCVDPLADYYFNVRKCLLICFAIGGRTGKFRNIGYKSLVRGAPIEDYFVLRHRHRPEVYPKTSRSGNCLF